MKLPTRKKNKTEKFEKALALRIKPGLDGVDLVDINVDDNIGKDPNYNKEFALSEATIPFRHNGKVDHVYLLDGGKGVSVKLQRSERVETVGEDEDAREISLLTMETSPARISAILDTTLMQRAYTLKPDRRTIVIAFFIGVGVGFFTGLFF